MDEQGVETPGAGLDARLRSLLLAAAAGDVGAFEQFYASTVRMVLPSVRRICGEIHCEDALADAYFQAWKTLASFDPARGTAMSWLKTIARTRALDCLRRERALHDGLAGAPEFDPDEQPHLAAGPVEIAQTRQEHARLQAALAALPTRQRQLLALIYDRDCTHQEIAQITGMPLGTVRHLLRQSHSRLQDSIQPGGDALQA